MIGVVWAAYSAYVCCRVDEHARVVVFCEGASAEDVVSVCDFYDVAET